MGETELVLKRDDVLAWRVTRHQLDRPPDSAAPTDVDVLDAGVQDTGTGHRWGLAIRGARRAAGDELVLLWALRGGPHAFRRSDAAALAVALAPFSEADAAKRVFDASKPLREAGIDVLDALRAVAVEMRTIVTEPTVKGDVSSELARRMGDPYLRWCRPCEATHLYEQPFRLAALPAGLELDPDTAPPVMRRVSEEWPMPLEHLGNEADPRLHVVRTALRFGGPASVDDLSAFIDMPKRTVRDHLPADSVEVKVEGDGSVRYVLAGDLDEIAGAATRAELGLVRLLGTHDPYLQQRDRTVVVPDPAQRKALWKILGRPGGLLVGHEIVGEWRPKASGRNLTLKVEAWRKLTAREVDAVETEAERLAEHRSQNLKAVEVQH